MSRILVISDDQAFALSLRVLLMRDGHAVMAAEDASAGLFRLFMDKPRFVVVNLRLESEMRKVCRQLYESAKVPYLIIGAPALLEHSEFKAWLPPGSFLACPVSVRRIWSGINTILRKRPDVPVKGSLGGPGGVDEAPHRMRGPGYPRRRNNDDRSSDRRCQTYQRYSQMDPDQGQVPRLQVWV